MKWSGSVFKVAFEHTEDILNTYFSCVWYLYRRTLWQSYVCAVAYSGHFRLHDLTKPAITIASFDRFKLNLVICLQLDIALLIQNAVKKCDIVCQSYNNIYRGYFFADTVYIHIARYYDKYSVMVLIFHL